MDNSKIWWGVNNSWMGTASGDNDGNPATGANAAYSNLSGELFPLCNRQQDSADHNFGQLGFDGAVPAGALALCTANLSDPTIADPSAYFQPTLYTGNGSTQSIDQDGNSTFEPDFVWIKNRSAADDHCLFDSARGATKLLISNDSDAETTDADTLTSFDSDGFSLGDDDKVNTNTENYVAWQWLESATGGFDIVEYTGNATNRTISHSLGAVPELMIVRRTNATENWGVYHGANTSDPETEALILDLTNATNSSVSTVWNDTAPTSSVFTVGTGGMTNPNPNPYIAYLFVGVEGFSKFGKYTGNGDDPDGPFAYLGFSPAWVMIKRTDSTNNWKIHTKKVEVFNPINQSVSADTSSAENTETDHEIDFLSNGFCIKENNSAFNASGGTYIYAAFAEAPFVNSNGVPCNAR